MIEMKVKGLTLDPLTNVPIVILREAEGERSLPIWVGIFEAHAIAREIEEFQTPRPMMIQLELFNTSSESSLYFKGVMTRR